MSCKLLLGMNCPLAEHCPSKATCERGDLEATPFLKELQCLHTTLYRLAKDSNEGDTRLPKLTLNEAFCNLLWLFRGAVEKATRTVYNMKDYGTNFTAFDKILWTWEKTIKETNAAFLTEALSPLKAQRLIHDLGLRKSPELPLFDEEPPQIY